MIMYIFLFNWLYSTRFYVGILLANEPGRECKHLFVKACKRRVAMLWRADPWRELERMRKELDAVFGNGYLSRASAAFPLINVYDHDDELMVTAEMPGMKKEDVSITVSNGILTIAGNRKAGIDDAKYCPVRKERATGEFEKSFSLPTKIDQEKISATFKNGVLTIALPKAEEAKPRQIAINVA